MAFEKFSDTARSFRPKVSVRKSGTISFNSGCVKKFNLKGVSFVTLFFDKDSKMVGVMPSDKSDEGSHALHKGKTGAWVSGRRFLDFYGFSPKSTVRMDAEWNEKDKMIVFALPSETA